MHLHLQRLFQRPAGRLIITTSLLIATPSLCVGSYLADLEAEAGSTDVQAGEESELNWSHKKQGLSEGLQTGMSHEEFEHSLRDNYYGSFLFYEKLSPWNKKQVYDTYQESNNVDKIRREIKIRMTK